MKKSEIDFTKPMRQSYVAIVLIIIATYKSLIKQALPFAVVFLVGGQNADKVVVITFIALSVIALIVSVVKYFNFYFYVDGDELIIEKGVLQKTRLSVPFERIQTVNFEQTVIHRLFNSIKLIVDTAGSKEKEFEFRALDRDVAEELRELLIEKKSQRKSSLNEMVEKILPKRDEKLIYALSFTDLIKAGMVENHFKSFLLIMSFLFWIWSGLEDIGFQEEVEDGVMAFMENLMILIYLTIVFLIIAFLISIIRMLVKNYNLNFLRTEQGFKIQAGLFTQHVTSAQDNKIQMISWSDNPLKKIIGVVDLKLKQARSSSSSKKTIIIPGAKLSHVDQTYTALYGEQMPIDNFRKVDKSYFLRGALYLSIFIIIPSLVAIYFSKYILAIILSSIYVYNIIARYKRYNKLRFGFNSDMIIIKEGAFGDSSTMLPIYKIQTIEKTQSPYQRRKFLSSIIIYTASGSVTIPYIAKNIADSYVDRLIYTVEKSKKKWM